MDYVTARTPEELLLAMEAEAAKGVKFTVHSIVSHNGRLIAFLTIKNGRN